MNDNRLIDEAHAPLTLDQSTQRDIEARNQLQPAPFTALLDAGMRQTIPWMATQDAYGLGYPLDDKFELTQPLMDELTKGVHQDYWGGFVNARSEQHAQYLAAIYRQQSRAREDLASRPIVGTGVALAAGVLDPVALSTAMLTGGGSELVAAGRAARLASAVRNGLVNAAAFGEMEMLRKQFDPSVRNSQIAAASLSGLGIGTSAEALASNGRIARLFGVGGAAATGQALGEVFDPEIKARDIWASAGTQFILGGLTNAMHGAKPDIDMEQVARNWQKRAMLDDVLASGAEVTVNGKKYFSDVPPEPKVQKQMRASAMDFDAVGTDWTPSEPVKPMVVEPVEAAPVSIAATGASKPTSAETTPVLTVFRQGKEGQYFTTSTKYLEGAGFKGNVQSFELPTSFKIYDGTNDPGLSKLLTPEEANILRTASASSSRTTFKNVRDAALRREGFDGYSYLDEGADGNNYKTIFLLKERTESLKSPTSSIGAAAHVPMAESPTVSTAAAGAATPGGITPGNPPKPGFEVGDLDLTNVTDGHTWGNRVTRMGDQPSMGSASELPTARWVMNAVAADPLAKADSPGVFSAHEWATNKRRVGRVEVMNLVDQGYAKHIEYSKKNGQKPLAASEFREAVSRANRRGLATGDPGIDAAVQDSIALRTKYLELMKRHGVPGAEETDPRDDYVNRQWNREKLDELGRKYTPATVIEFLRDSIMAKTPGIGPRLAETMGKAIYDNAGSGGHSPLEMGMMLAGKDVDGLSGLLRDAGVPEPTILDLNRYLRAKEGDSENPVPLKRRIDLDETYKAELKDGAGNGTGEIITLEDLLHNDAEELLHAYVNSAIGSSGIAEIGRAMPLGPGDTAPNTRAGILRMVLNEEKSLGIKEKGTVNRLDAQLKMVAGVPLHEETLGTLAVGSIKHANFGRMLSGVGTGIANTSEAVGIMSQTGLKATFQVIPAFKEIWQTIRKGEASTDNMRELTQLTAAALEYRAGAVRPRRAKAGNLAETTLRDVNYQTARYARLASVVSLQSQVQSFLSGWAAKAVQQKLYNIAKSGKVPNKKILGLLTLDESQWSKVADNLKQHVTTGKYGAVDKLNTHLWDTEAGTLFRNALAKEKKRLVMDPDPSHAPLWMSNPYGSVFIQFRKFGYAAWANKLLPAIQAKSLPMFGSMLLESVGAMGLYMLRSTIDSVGRPDGQEWLNDRLSADKVAMAGFSRATWSSIMPTAVDTVWGDMMRNRPIFGYARTSGIEGGALLGNPTVDYVNSVMHGIGSAGSLFFDDDIFTKQDVEDIKKAAQVPNIPGLYNLIRAMADDLPDRDKNAR